MRLTQKLGIFRLLTLIILPLALFFFFRDRFVYPVGSTYSDITVSHYPNLVFIRNTINQFHQIPLWSGSILSGYPFTANPLSSLWYFPAWLLWVLPLPSGINFLICAHLFFGGLGMFLFLRQQQYSEWVSLVGAIGFELMPKLLGHYSAGHMTLVFAVTWTPWLLYQETKFYKKKSVRRYLVGVILGMMILADVRWAAFAGILWVSYSLCHFITNRRLENKTHPSPYKEIAIKDLGSWLFYSSKQVIIGVFIAAPLIFPLIQYIQYSSRNLMSSADSLSFSLPVEALIGLVFPNMAGDAEQIVYFGSLSYVVLLWILTTPVFRKKMQFWLVVIAVSIFFSLGSHVPGMDWIIQLPGFNLLRVPSRSLMITGIAMSVVTSAGLDALFSKTYCPDDQHVRYRNLSLAALVIFLVLMATGISIINGSPQIEFIWGALFSFIFTVLILLKNNGKVTNNRMIILFLPLLVFDLFVVDYSQFQLRTPEDVLAEGESAASYLASKKDLFRVYSPSYSIPQHTAAKYGLELADGVDPLQMSHYVEFMKSATGVPNTGYSVTMPPFSSGRPGIDNQNYVPNIKQLGLLNVRYVVAEYDIFVSDLTLLGRFGETRVYENPFSMPRAWVQSTDQGESINILSRPDIIKRTPNLITIAATGPGKLIVAEINYPGWAYSINGNQIQNMYPNELLRIVDLPPGKNVIEMAFKPVWVYLGLFLSLITWMILMFTKNIF